MIEIITGSLLDSKEKYICHQTNCVSTGNAAGIAKTLFEQYAYADCYKSRIEQSEPGTIDIRGDGINNRFIINMFSQFYPGNPKYPDSYKDGLLAREKYFHKCLLKIAKIENLESVAFNWRIGCGLAGGNWNNYLGNLNNFSEYVFNKQQTRVIIYRQENDE